jgi:hypothetical protein
MCSDQSMDVEVRLGAYEDWALHLIDIPPSKCHWVSSVSKCSRFERFDHHAKVQHRCYIDWMDDVWAARVVGSFEASSIALRHSQALLAHTVPRPRSCRRSRRGSRNRKTCGSRVHESAHQSICVPMPWRKLSAFTSHNISRSQSKMSMTFVHHLSYKTTLCGVALRYNVSNTSNKPLPRSSNDSQLEERRPRYMGTEQQAAATSRTWDG